MEEKKLYGEHLIVRCSCREETQAVCDYYKDYRLWWNHWEYVIWREKEGDMLFSNIPSSLNHLPIYTYNKWKELINKFNTKQTMTKYRIRTEQEFISNFGTNWQNRVSIPWNSSGDMDYLIGHELDETESIWFKKYGSLTTNGWLVSEDCIITINVDSSFTDKFRNNPAPKVVAKKVTSLYFGDVLFKITEGDSFAVTGHGKVTKEEILKAINYLENTPKLAGYELTVFSANGQNYTPLRTSVNLGFGCKRGTYAELVKISKAF